MKKSAYESAADAVRETISEWNAHEWWPTSPDDPEFDNEIKAIAKQLPRINSERDAAEAISRVFRSSFSSREFTVDFCMKPGVILWSKLVARNAVS